MTESNSIVPRTVHTLCGLCRNSSDGNDPTEVSSCGVCVYHKECSVGITACECGFPYQKLLSIGTTCMGCKKPAVDKFFCRFHLNEAVSQLKNYSNRGIDCSVKQAGMCTPFSVLKTNGLLLSKLDGDVWKKYILRFAKMLPGLHPDIFIVHNDTLLTLASRLKQHIDNRLKSEELDVFELADEIFDSKEQITTAIKMLKNAYPKLSITHKGKILPKGSAKGINSVVRNSIQARVTITNNCPGK